MDTPCPVKTHANKKAGVIFSAFMAYLDNSGD